MLVIPVWFGVIACVLWIVGIAMFFWFLSETNNNVLPLISIILSILFFATMLLLLFGGTPVYKEEYAETIDLYALDSGMGVKGQFFLFSGGSVKDMQYYMGYTNVGNKDYKQIKFDASKTILRLDDEETPRAEIYNIRLLGNIFNLFLIDKFNADTKTVIYIPTDGLKNSYAVN